MSNKIRLGIVGYGNLGKGIENNIKYNEDMELVAIFTRRDPKSLNTESNVRSVSEIVEYKDKIDVMILCGGSHSDLPKQTPSIASMFNTVDSYDNHSNIPEYFEAVDSVANSSNTTSLISIGWDPGLFSLNRLLFQSILPQGSNYTFWGKGVSQGHSQVLRAIEGVKHGVQYTLPIKEALDSIRAGNAPVLEPYERHRRVCYIVSNDDSLNKEIEKNIKSIPGYFKEYDTEVNFITEEEFIREHSSMPHGGSVLHSGRTSKDITHTMEFKLDLAHNPEFTSSILLAYARACHRLSKENSFGAYTIFDIPIGYLSPDSDYDIRKKLL